MPNLWNGFEHIRTLSWISFSCREGPCPQNGKVSCLGSSSVPTSPMLHKCIRHWNPQQIYLKPCFGNESCQLCSLQTITWLLMSNLSTILSPLNFGLTSEGYLRRQLLGSMWNIRQGSKHSGLLCSQATWIHLGGSAKGWSERKRSGSNDRMIEWCNDVMISHL